MNAWICLKYIARTIIAGHRVNLFSTFPEKAKLFFQSGSNIFFPWVSIGKPYFSRVLSISPKISNLLGLRFLSYLLLFDVCSVLGETPLSFYFRYCLFVSALYYSLPVSSGQKWFPGSLSSLGSYISSPSALVISYDLVRSLLLWRRSF